MHVVVAHNRYRSAFPSGENAVVERDVALLTRAGVKVTTMIVDSDSIGTGARDLGSAALSTVWSRHSARRLLEIIAVDRPDVLHLHNPYPLLSPSVISAAAKAGVPVVQTVHNYRFACPAGTYFRDGGPCVECRGSRLALPAVRHGCYRSSRPQSAVMALSMATNRKAWNLVSCYLAVSEFIASQLAEHGVPESKIRVRRNSVPDLGVGSFDRKGFVFVGRLDVAKGIALLLDAWQESGLGDQTTLTIVGDGPDRPLVERAAEIAKGIAFRGVLPRAEAHAAIKSARVLVVPSLSFEGLPTTIIEGFSAGTPVIASRLGAMTEMVTPSVGWLAEPTVDDLAHTMRRAASADLATKGAAARRLFEAAYADEVALASLLACYDAVISGDARRIGK